MESHLDKIKKLLRLSKSSNAHEAELAMQRAMELAARHAIDISNLHDDPDVGDIVHRWFPTKARLSREWKLALQIAATYFHVSPCLNTRQKRVVLVGRTDAIEVADYIITFLVRECRRLVASFAEDEKRARRRMTSGKRAAFISGFFTGIGSRLREGQFDLMREDGRFAIVLKSESDKRDAEMAKIVGKTREVKDKKPRRSAATIAGYISGRATTLARPLPGAPPQQGMLALT